MGVAQNERSRRRYRQGLRAAASAATRRRIVEATLALHEELGPESTTWSAIARRAGVPRMTVYRHFPDEETLFAACSGAYAVEHPPPDIGAAFAEINPIERLRAVMATLFVYYRATEPMTAQLLRSAETHAPTRERMRPYRDLIEMVTVFLVPALVADPARQHVVAATVRHTLAFATWQSLAIDGRLSDEEVTDLLVGLVEAAMSLTGRV
jgi:AcrR family transcriptional regulator